MMMTNTLLAMVLAFSTMSFAAPVNYPTIEISVNGAGLDRSIIKIDIHTSGVETKAPSNPSTPLEWMDHQLDHTWYDGTQLVLKINGTDNAQERCQLADEWIHHASEFLDGYSARTEAFKAFGNADAKTILGWQNRATGSWQSALSITANRAQMCKDVGLGNQMYTSFAVFKNSLTRFYLATNNVIPTEKAQADANFVKVDDAAVAAVKAFSWSGFSFAIQP